MSIEWITLLMFGGLVLLLAMGLPLAFATGLIGVGFTAGLFGMDGLQLVASRIYSFMNEYALVSVPMFVMMASILERSGVARDRFDAMRVWAGGMAGGLG
ncbi:MAG: TRAP transporter large permease subunit, partial [Betaproteobacteria bacterium]